MAKGIPGRVRRRRGVAEFVAIPDRPWEGNTWKLGRYEVELTDADACWTVIVRRDGAIWVRESLPTRLHAKYLAEEKIGADLAADRKELVGALHKIAFGLKRVEKSLVIKRGGGVEFNASPICSGHANPDGSWTATIDGVVSTGQATTGKAGALEMLRAVKAPLDERVGAVIGTMCKLNRMKNDP